MSFGLLFLIVAAGLLGPMASGSRKFSLPMVAGEILAGVVIGNSGLRWLNVTDPTLTFLSSVGFAMLLFVVGTRLPLINSGSVGSPTARRGVKAAIITFAAAIPLAFLVSELTGIHHPAMFALLLGASSTSTIMPILAERKIGGDVMNALNIWIPLADIATIVALPLAMGEGNVLSMALGCVLVTVVGTVGYLGIKQFRNSDTGEHYRQLSKERAWALDLRLQQLLLFGLAAIATKFGASVLIAGFVAGMVSTLIGQPKRFENQLTGLAEGLFVPLFFVYIGARIDMRALFGSVANLELLGVIVVAGLIAHLIGARLARLPLSTGLVTAQTMGLPAAVVSLGLSAGVLSAGQAAAIVTAALVTLVACSFGTLRLPRATEENGDEQGR
jgi:Kef-type K+ transport system membrane component KefB